jgi:drug/metabolite transporter (DMT)-like permease
MELSWFIYSMAAVVLIGMSMVFYKLPSLRNYSPFISTFYTNGLTAIFAAIVLIALGATSSFRISWFGVLWGLLFAATMILQKIVLKTVETNALFPVTSSIGNVITIAIGIVFLSEKLSLLQILGGAIILLSVYLFSRKKEDFPLTFTVISLAAGIVLVSTASKYVQKFTATTEPLLNLMVWQYIGASVAALIAGFIFEKNIPREIMSIRKYSLGAFLISIFSFAGGFAILKALSMAPLSLVYAIHPTYILVTAIAGALIFKENLTRKKVLLIVLMVVGIILIKIG